MGIRICDITQFYAPSGGVKRYIDEKQEFIRQKGEDEHFLIIPGKKTCSFHTPPIHIYSIRSPFISQYSQHRVLLNLSEAIDLLIDLKADIIEAGDPYQSAWLASWAAKKLKVPVVGYYHSHFPDAYVRTYFGWKNSFLEKAFFSLSRWYAEEIYSQFDLTFVPTLSLLKLLRKWGVNNGVHVPLGVDIKTFAPGPPNNQICRLKLGIPDDAFLLLYVGRLAREKNINLLLETFLYLLDHSPKKDYWLLIIGDGPLRKDVLKLKKNVSRISWISQIDSKKDLADFYRSADLFIHPGIVETFGLVTIESQACGCPVIGFRGTHMESLTEEEFAEYWADRKDFRALAEAVDKARSLDLKKLGRNLALKIHQKYSWKKTFEQIWYYYYEAISNPFTQKIKNKIGSFL
ncbi:glycosyltransferase [Methylacidiphilum caldifontis]|uniref:Glycosyl transferase n=1 Tax=Methylacidiphilum caldifontis TaxID=2795386 RepID=A0A4Y8P7H2_9BACT|nr:glycosyltransferase [Methylacidiphilum caldifontis]QSR88883.1 glycosyltransferase [Methylacidiphilum caldifontis]TFE66207.1 glycosyl transferase [Methylacidiphilum caldifontis]